MLINEEVEICTEMQQNKETNVIQLKIHLKRFNVAGF